MPSPWPRAEARKSCHGKVAELAEDCGRARAAGHVNERGVAYSAKSVRAMLAQRLPNAARAGDEGAFD